MAVEGNNSNSRRSNPSPPPSRLPTSRRNPTKRQVSRPLPTISRNQKPFVRITCCLPWKFVMAFLLVFYSIFLYSTLSRVHQDAHQQLKQHEQQQQKQAATKLDNDVNKHLSKLDEMKLSLLKPQDAWNRTQQQGGDSRGNTVNSHTVDLSRPRVKQVVKYKDTQQQASQKANQRDKDQQQPNKKAELQLPFQESWASAFLETARNVKREVPTRVEAWYRTIMVEMERKVGDLVTKTLQSCRRSGKTSANSFSTDPLASCRPPSNQRGPFVYYNSLETHSRIVCGHSIPPRETLQLNKPCTEPASRLFPVFPDATGQGMPPVVTRFKGNNGAAIPFGDCDIGCHTVGKFSIVTYRTIDGPNWHITMSMEGPDYYGNLRIDPQGWKDGKFWSTTAFDSEIPLPYYSRAEYKIWDGDPPVDFDTAIKGGVFMARNCHSRNHREQLVGDLQALANQHKTVRIDSVSSCLHNAELPPGTTKANKRSVLNKYLFYFAFENQCVTDYITEKLWGPFEAGTLPVYYGAPNVLEHVPPHSLVKVQQFKDTPSLYKYLEQLANNRTMYEEYHAWRTKPRPAFDVKMNLTYTHGTCRTCRWAYARMYGTGWNHLQQRLEELRVGRRNACLDPATGLLQRPVQEQWAVAGGDGGSKVQIEQSSTQNGNSNGDGCLLGTLTQKEITLSTGNGETAKVLRVLRQVDGVIDLELHELSATATPKLELRLTTRLHEDESKAIHFVQVVPGHGRLQDAQSRFTVLTSPKTINVAAHDNVVVVTVDALPARLRLLSEDVDNFHQGAAEAENYFGDVMIKDFYYPVEVFAVQ